MSTDGSAMNMSSAVEDPCLHGRRIVEDYLPNKEDLWKAGLIQ